MQAARPPLQEIMDSNANASPDPDTAARRRSGRVVKAPDRLAPEPSSQSVAKRKRDGADDDDENEDDEDDLPELDEEDSDEPDPESEDEAAPSRKSRKSQSKRAKKPASKKPKINGTQSHATNRTMTLPRMPKKSVRLNTEGKGNGLYGMPATQVHVFVEY